MLFEETHKNKISAHSTVSELIWLEYKSLMEENQTSPYDNYWLVYPTKYLATKLIPSILLGLFLVVFVK